jgi:hypothetical protein
MDRSLVNLVYGPVDIFHGLSIRKINVNFKNSKIFRALTPVLANIYFLILFQ